MSGGAWSGSFCGQMKALNVTGGQPRSSDKADEPQAVREAQTSGPRVVVRKLSHDLLCQAIELIESDPSKGPLVQTRLGQKQLH